MTGERFNSCQIEALKSSFAAAAGILAEKYQEMNDDPADGKPHYGNAVHWQAMHEAIRDFERVAGLIGDNRLEQVTGLEWRSIMFLLEVIEHNDCGRQERQAVARGLRLLVGMFRNQFPGEKWNPDEFRWTTVGDVGERGISPMLMAIAEL